MTGRVTRHLADEQAMVAFGTELGTACLDQPGLVIFLGGELGMGKTTLSRGILRAFGHTGAVKSPTYTLVEPYRFGDRCVYHFDLYRLGDPEELEYMGIRDYFAENGLCLVEWAEKGTGFLPAPDLMVSIELDSVGRSITVTANTTAGTAVLDALVRL